MDRISGIIRNWEDTIDRRRKAGVTIEELGLRFVQICMENYWSGCLLPVFFLAGILWDIFYQAGEKNPECSCII